MFDRDLDLQWLGRIVAEPALERAVQGRVEDAPAVCKPQVYKCLAQGAKSENVVSPKTHIAPDHCYQPYM